MPYTASSLIKYARSLADLQNSKVITYEDEINLINESYRDIYNKYIESELDYYTERVVIDITPAMVDPTSINGNEYFVPLPINFYKLRTVSWNTGGRWQIMKKFNTDQMDDLSSEPYYRMRNSKLWLLFPQGTVPQIKVDYYTPPQIITTPDVELSFLTDQTAIYQSSIKFPFYINANDQDILIYSDGNLLHYQNITTGEVGPMTTSALIPETKAIYYKGYVYFIMSPAGANKQVIAKAPWNLIGLVGTTSIIIDDTINNNKVVDFTINNNIIYYSMKNTITDVYTTANYDLSTSTTYGLLPSGIEAINITFLNDGTFIANSIDGFLTTYYYDVHDLTQYIDLQSTGFNFVTSNLTSDGTNFFISTIQNISTSIYDYSIYKIILDKDPVTNIPFVKSYVQIDSDISYMGVNMYGRAAIKANYESFVKAITLVEDTILSYPSNEVNEIMAYQSAINYVRKQSDDKKVSMLLARLTDLWNRFIDVNKQDEFSVIRINNAYRENSFWI